MVQKLVEENMSKLKEAKDELEMDELMSIHHDLKRMEMSIAEILGNVTVK